MLLNSSMRSEGGPIREWTCLIKGSYSESLERLLVHTNRYRIEGSISVLGILYLCILTYFV